MVIPEAQFMACNRGKYKDLSIRLTIKAGDYSLAEYERWHDMAEVGAVCAVVIEEHGEKVVEKDRTLANFRMDVIRDFGNEAYRKVKERLGVEHLRDLPEEGRVEVLKQEMEQLRLEHGYYDN